MIGEARIHQDDDELDTYGVDAARLLGPLQNKIHGISLDFSSAFCAGLGRHPGLSAIIRQLDARDVDALIITQSRYFMRLLSPRLSATRHRKKARHYGRIHALVGVSADEFTLAMQDYKNLLYQKLHEFVSSPETRDKLAQVIGDRIKYETYYELEGMSRVDQARHSLLLYLESQAGNWPKNTKLVTLILQAMMDHLPDLRGIWYGGPNVDEHIVAEYTYGCSEDFLADIISSGIKLPLNKTNTGLDQSSTLRAWFAGEISSTASYAVSPGVVGIQLSAQKYGIRSSASVPILDPKGNPGAVLTLLGKYPNQFESPSAQFWLRCVQHFIQRNVVRNAKSGVASPFILKKDRERYRTLLYSGGLRMHMQPIIDLGTGKIVKIEALARLQDSNFLIMPDQFLQACSTQDLIFLFRSGMNQALPWLHYWDRVGLRLDMSINLPPCALIDQNCTDWVEEALATNGIPPSRLCLEFLESEEDEDVTKRDATLVHLAKLGTKLLMDDLGTGYNGLLRLQTLPFSAIKIDHLTVRHSAESPKKSIPFLSGLLRIVHDLGMQVIMEGLETPELVEMAAVLGVKFGQGYAISKPVPPEAVLAIIAQRSWTIDPDQPIFPLGKRADAFRRMFSSGVLSD